MKKTALLNREISAVVAAMGHGQMLVIADCGLPIPEHVPCIDLSLLRGQPTLLSVLQAVMSELCVEKFTLATELPQASPLFHRQLLDEIATWSPQPQTNVLSHEQFKELSSEAVVIIRSGECTPYANIILHSGVSF
ncbi:ribose transport protein RbsD [Sinobacterium caligoides]|uniref:D-ribose pyranase n=1 Tax=Sinobacterium caligoides TaxID=933926 RepID=A0A3N2DPC5_9GAMM|nr:D-ribose pyranase [Sinobacterium caligoides]ROS01653.1 ribose transport protein RbsD [Sinobacterium caligoides]